MELLAEQAQPARRPIDMGDPGSPRPRPTYQGTGPHRVECRLARLHRLEEFPPGLPPRGGPHQGRPLRPQLGAPPLHAASLACSHIQGDLLCCI